MQFSYKVTYKTHVEGPDFVVYANPYSEDHGDDRNFGLDWTIDKIINTFEWPSDSIRITIVPFVNDRRAHMVLNTDIE